MNPTIQTAQPTADPTSNGRASYVHEVDLAKRAVTMLKAFNPEYLPNLEQTLSRRLDAVALSYSGGTRVPELVRVPRQHGFASIVLPEGPYAGPVYGTAVAVRRVVITRRPAPISLGLAARLTRCHR